MRHSLADELLSLSFRDRLKQMIAPHNGKAANRKGQQRDCARRTREERKKILLHAYAELAEMGYRLTHPESLRRKHVQALTTRWREKHLSPKTLHTRLSVLRTFAVWLGKRNVVDHITAYYPADQIRRCTVATTNKAWEANGVLTDDVIERARAIDERLARYLTLQKECGLRVKESIEIRPLRAIGGDRARLVVIEGTKGGRPRVVPIQTEAQRRVVAWAEEVALKGRSGRLRWPDCTWNQARNRFYYYMRVLGITRAEAGVTAHGLRHGYSQQQYGRETGLPTPIEGGKPEDIGREAHHIATIRVSETLGHGRYDVGATYYGSYGYKFRTVPAKKSK